MKKSKVIIFGVIALREAKFWANVVQKLDANKNNIFFISFCSISTDYLRTMNFKVLCIYDNSTQGEIVSEPFRNDKDPIFLHESLTFIESKKYVFKRYKTYFLKFNLFLKELIKKLSIDPKSIYVIQELGAFSPVIALFDSSRFLGLKHFFLEPSILTEHTFILENTADLYPIKAFNISKNAPSFDGFLKQISDATQIASKDTLNLKNKSLSAKFNLWCRFFRKLRIKLSPSVNTYYDRLLASVYQRFKRYLSDFLLQKTLPKYEINKLKNFAYYPLHSDIDFALTIRNPEYLNQFNNLVSLLNKNDVVIKQHPTRSYTFRIRDILKLIFQNISNSKKVYLANSNLNSLEISSKALFTYYISSKAGVFAELKNFKTFTPIKINFSNSSPEEFYNDIVSKSFNFDLYSFSNKNIINTKLFLENIHK